MTFVEWWQKLGIFHGRDTVNGLIEPMAFAALTWEAAQPKWLPIETAPKGETILLLTEYGDVISGQWDFEDRDDLGQWFGWQEPLDQKVTHWMPLPPSPQEQRQ